MLLDHNLPFRIGLINNTQLFDNKTISRINILHAIEYIPNYYNMLSGYSTSRPTLKLSF